MNNLFKSYLNFTRTERMGIVALLLLIGALILVRATMQFWVHPAAVEMKQVAIPAKKVKREVQSLNTQYYRKQLPAVKVNLNTADSLTLMSLPGIGKGISHRILERRRKLGKFTDMEQVFELYHFKDETREMLLQHTTLE